MGVTAAQDKQLDEYTAIRTPCQAPGYGGEIIASTMPHHHEVIAQDDTFFHCASGRLMLRDLGNGHGQLGRVVKRRALYLDVLAQAQRTNVANL